MGDWGDFMVWCVHPFTLLNTKEKIMLSIKIEHQKKYSKSSNDSQK